MQSQVKICKSCEHCKPLWFMDALGCNRDAEKQKTTNLVTGELVIVGRSRMCEEERKSGWLKARLFGLCGKEGRFFVKESTEIEF